MTVRLALPPLPELVEQLVGLLADALAPRIADELAARLNPAAGSGNGSARLLSLDELVAELPAAKSPATWRRWLYERLRRGEVPGAVKLGGSWFLDGDAVREWIEAGAPCDRRHELP